MKIIQYFILKLLLIFPLESYSHGGGLNKNGCHNNRSTGEYHCHGSKFSNKSNKLKSESISFGNENSFNLKLASYLGGKTEVTYNYNYNVDGKSPRIASVRIDIVTNEYVIEGGLDKRSSLDSIQQAVFASTLAGKKPAVAIYDTNGRWGKFEHRIFTAAKNLGIKFFWVSENSIKELN